LAHTTSELFDDDLGADTLFEQAYMRDNPDGLVILAEGFERGDRDFQGFRIERAESFIDKEYPLPIALVFTIRYRG